MPLTITTINTLNMKLYVVHTDYHIIMTNYTHTYIKKLIKKNAPTSIVIKRHCGALSTHKWIKILIQITEVSLLLELCIDSRLHHVHLPSFPSIVF